MTTTFTHIGEVIAYLRKKKGMSQQKLSHNVCSREYLIKIEKGQQYPTSHIINGLCNNLNHDIYEEYSLILRHGGFAEHNMITELNDCFSKKKEHLLPDLIAKCEKLCPQAEGELYQYLCYAKSICALDLQNNPIVGLDCALEGITCHHPNYTLDTPLTEFALSNIDITLIYYYINNLCEQGCTANAVPSYLHLYEYIKKKLDTNNYIVHKKYHFEINMLSGIVVNAIIYNSGEIPYRKMYDILNEVLEIKKKYNYSNSLPTLLFEKCYLCEKLGYTQEYQETLPIAISISEFLVGTETTSELKEWLINQE